MDTDDGRLEHAPIRVLFVGEPEDDVRREERHRHRQEEHQLERDRPAHLLGEHGEHQPESGEHVEAHRTARPDQ
ncbi:hypothetical protein ACFWC9_13870 [Streptomyces goshikiensis]|uniref:hypothetical protein n=1 Tax=Streptomyces goshikiensis TaxID=1942 RepID=UPI0036A3DDF5